jgi:hypothetical protein
MLKGGQLSSFRPALLPNAPLRATNLRPMDRVHETAAPNGATGARRSARSYWYFWRFT